MKKMFLFIVASAICLSTYAQICTRVEQYGGEYYKEFCCYLPFYCEYTGNCYDNSQGGDAYVCPPEPGFVAVISPKKINAKFFTCGERWDAVYGGEYYRKSVGYWGGEGVGCVFQETDECSDSSNGQNAYVCPPEGQYASILTLNSTILTSSLAPLTILNSNKLSTSYCGEWHCDPIRGCDRLCVTCNGIENQHKDSPASVDPPESDCN